MDTTRRALLGRLIGTPLAVAAWPAAARAADIPEALAVGRPLALPAELPLIGGGAFRAAEAEGRATVLYWWASWCPFCAEMSPAIDKLWRAQQAAAAQGRGLRVLAISVDRTLEPARAYLQRKGHAFPSAWQGAAATQPLPQVRGVPLLCVRDRAGRVALVEKGQMFPEDVEALARLA